MRPYHKISIIESGELLVKIPLELFAVETPHPYESLGANYGQHSPYFLRETVVKKLIAAQNYLHSLHPGWYIQIFDAYRPVDVQQFMVDYSFAQALGEQGIDESDLSPQELGEIWQKVYDIWAVPSLDMKTPPPHSTGAAVDITLVNNYGEVVNMGSPIDEMSERSYPDYFADKNPEFHRLRQLLNDVMIHVGFQRNPREWWHFSYGDQMWAWLSNQTTAYYGRWS
ncbi:MAG: D-alanyl-D-alanine dipeptidase [Sphaerospermopsis sp. SIO1G2]|nr:D-alanyl-D-alanine dipeptidase [Sphaerospermopsis sp. SIO1G1]NET71788.1 D-alanyl-D-alanine dipeptidase [Sphaerospermopsis sp. SIO1G2]